MKAYRTVLLLIGFALPLPGLTQTVYEGENLTGQAPYREMEMKMNPNMQEYVIERDIPGAGNLSATELRNISRKSNEVLREMGPGIQWVQSYVTPDKIYCIYRAESEDAIRSHAKAGGFPANRISQVRTMIDPRTGD